MTRYCGRARDVRENGRTRRHVTWTRGRNFRPRRGYESTKMKQTDYADAVVVVEFDFAAASVSDRVVHVGAIERQFARKVSSRPPPWRRLND